MSDQEKLKEEINKKICDAMDAIGKGSIGDGVRHYVDSIEILLNETERLSRGDVNRRTTVMEKAEMTDQYIKKCAVTVEPKSDIEGIVGNERFLKDIKSRVKLAAEHPEVYEHGVLPFSTFLLFGLPGNGKTTMARAVAQFAKFVCGSTFYCTAASDIITKYQGESEACFIALFDKARRDEHSIIFFDEVDELLSNRGQRKESETGGHLKSIFLREIDGIKGGIPNCILIAATNKPGTIDSAAWSRFEKKYFIDLPTQKERASLFREELKQLPLSFTDKKLKKFAKASEGYSGRDIRTVVKEAWAQNLENWKDFTCRPVMRPEFIMKALNVIKSTIKEEEADKMNDFLVDNELCRM